MKQSTTSSTVRCSLLPPQLYFIRKATACLHSFIPICADSIAVGMVIIMNVIQKSEAIKNGLRKGFQDGSSKMAKRKCYGYTINSDGELEINPDEAKVVSWIFERYLAGDSLGKIAAGLERQGIPSPTGRPKWNREAIDKLLSNEKYTGRVLLQKTLSTGAVQIENNGLMERYLYTGSHEAIISDEMFMAVQQEKLSRSKEPQNHIAMKLSL